VIDRVITASAGVNWGDVPTWVSAGVTLGALIFAVAAVLVARRAFRLELERDRVNAEIRQRQDAYVRRSQSALVSAWWGSADESHARSRSAGAWGAFLRNASETPIYKANMTIVGGGNQAGPKVMEFPVVPPTRQPVFHSVTMSRAAPVAGQRGARAAPDCKVSLRFTDAAGIRWVRDEYGALRELEPGLLIWTSPEGAAVLSPFTAEFLATYGVRAALDTTVIEAELERKFIDAGPEGPDILIGPHDWVGGLVSRGLVEPIILSDQLRSGFTPAHLDAFSVGGQLYAVPASLDTVALIRNTDLAPDPPESIEDLIATGQDLKDRGLVSEILAVPVGAAGDPFHIWPLFTSAGGWLFGQQPDGTWDPARTGLDDAGTVSAFSKLRLLGDLGILRPEMTRERSFEVFGNRQAAFLLAASGAVVPARRSNVNFAVSVVPPFRDGQPSAPFLTINGFYVARHGHNRIVASDLVPDYLTRLDVMEAFGKMAHVIPLERSGECDPAIAAFHGLCAAAQPMPAFPGMRQVWTLLGQAELALIAGGDPADVARPVAEQLRGMSWRARPDDQPALARAGVTQTGIRQS
jgi:arabinogalactan oligomer / maltooligosaccharide transport system substrate-binding protein